MRGALLWSVPAPPDPGDYTKSGRPAGASGHVLLALARAGLNGWRAAKHPAGQAQDLRKMSEAPPPVSAAMMTAAAP